MKTSAETHGSDLPAGLAQPAIRALTAAGCQRLEQVAKFSESEISRMHGIGPKAVELLRRALAENGMAFAGEKPGKGI